jgi:hypothetical protein
VPVDLKKLLHNALAEMEREEQHDALEARFKALEERKPNFNIGDFVAALENASDEELDALEGTVLEGLVRETVREGEREPPPDDDNGKPKPTADDDDAPPARKRPGRKSGQVYDWWVDETGEVVPLKMARVYTGEDEDDEVDLPAKPDDDDKGDDVAA